MNLDDIPDLRKLAYFREILRHRSLRRAADVLGITQPALSRHIRDLEASFGVILLHRSATGSQCTEAGRLLLTTIDDLMGKLAETRKRFEDIKSHPSGVVTLALPSSVTMTFLPRLILSFARTFPDVHVRVIEGSARHVEEWLVERQADVGIIVAPSRSNVLLEEVVLTEDLRVFGPRRGRQQASWTWSEIASLPLIVPLPPYGTRRIIETAATLAKVTLTPRLEIDNPLSIRELVVSGEYYTIASPLIFAAAVKSGQVSSGAIVPAPARTLALATLRDAALGSATRALATALRRIIRLHWRSQPSL